jgi:hypothetical protein
MSGQRVAPATGVQARLARFVATRQIGPEGAEVAAIYVNHPRLARLFELTYLIAWENVRARMNSALAIPVGGFSDGRVCALPASARDEAVA